MDDLSGVGKCAFKNRVQILESEICGCYHCCEIFKPQLIKDWVDEVDGIGQTALCPKCGIDSVIGSASGYTVSRELLMKLNRHYF